MLTIIISVVVSVIATGLIFGLFTVTKKVHSKKKSVKIAQKHKLETFPEIISNAVKFVAKQNNLSYAEEIKALDKFDYDEDTHKQLLVNQHANKKVVSDKKMDKTFKIK